MRALVIDDSRAMRMILRRALHDLGFSTDEAGDGREALDRLEAAAAADEIPALCLIDWNMPRMDGLTFVQTVRRDPRMRGVTLVMVSTESEQRQIVRALAAGAHEYIIKPFTVDAIADKLDLLGLVPSEVAS